MEIKINSYVQILLHNFNTQIQEDSKQTLVLITNVYPE